MTLSEYKNVPFWIAKRARIGRYQAYQLHALCQDTLRFNPRNTKGKARFATTTASLQDDVSSSIQTL